MNAITGWKSGITNVSQGNQDAGNKSAVMNGSGTQSVGQKVHLNATPLVNGKPAPGKDPFVRSLKKADGSPAIDWRWTVDGKMAWNSQEVEDPFEWGSYDDEDNGCTPAPKLVKQFGPGRHEVKAWPLIAAEDNPSGEAVSGEADPIVWYID
jgi:hypothetical protein